MGRRNDHTMRNHLVVRSDPVPGESMIGYLRRLCIANGYDTLQWIFDKKIRFPEEIFVEENMWRIADATRCDCKIIRRNSYCIIGEKERAINFHGFVIDRNRIDLRYLNICPDCLLENYILKSVWDLVDYTACPEHGTNIVNRCPACGRFLSWMRASNTCECGMVEYDDYFTGMSSENEVACAKHISFLFEGKIATETVQQISENVKMLSLEDFLYCINRLYTIPVLDEKDNYIVKAERLFPNRKLCVSHSMGILMDWPAKFYEHIENVSEFIIRYGGINKIKMMQDRRFLLVSFLGMMDGVAGMIDGSKEVFDKVWFCVNKGNKLL